MHLLVLFPKKIFTPLLRYAQKWLTFTFTLADKGFNCSPPSVNVVQHWKLLTELIESHIAISLVPFVVGYIVQTRCDANPVVEEDPLFVGIFRVRVGLSCQTMVINLINSPLGTCGIMTRKSGAPNMMHCTTELIPTSDTFHMLAKEGTDREEFTQGYFCLLSSRRKQNTKWAQKQELFGAEKFSQHELALFLRRTISMTGGCVRLFSLSSGLSPVVWLLPWLELLTSWVTMNLLKWRRSAFGLVFVLNVKRKICMSWISNLIIGMMLTILHQHGLPRDDLHCLGCCGPSFAFFTIKISLFWLEKLLQPTLYCPCVIF